MQRKKKLRVKKIALLLALCFAIAGPVGPLTVYADLDPDIIAAARESANQDDAGDNGEETETQTAEEATEAETQPVSAREKYQPKINDIEEKMKDLESEKKKIQSSINEIGNEIAKEEQTKKELEGQIYVTSSEISLLLEKISLQEQSIEEQQEAIETKQQEIDDYYELFKVRLLAQDLNDDTTTLGLLLGADSFSDFLTRADTIAAIADYDRQLMEDLAQQKVLMEKKKDELELTKEELEESKQIADEKKQTLSVQQKAVEATIYNLAQMEKDFMADLENNKRKSDQMQAELNKIYEQIKWDENPYVGGELGWPLPGYYTITSYYGWRFNNSDFHTGIDISGSSVYGKNIVAANSGTVKVANWGYVQGSGYGIYVILDHGGNVSTLYGHCSNLLVSVGDKVEKGQAIAQVGSTGWSTGPHLHFEYRVNGVHQNPLGLLKSN